VRFAGGDKDGVLYSVRALVQSSGLPLLAAVPDGPSGSEQRERVLRMGEVVYSAGREGLLALGDLFETTDIDITDSDEEKEKEKEKEKEEKVKERGEEKVLQQAFLKQLYAALPVDMKDVRQGDVAAHITQLFEKRAQ